MTSKKISALGMHGYSIIGNKYNTLWSRQAASMVLVLSVLKLSSSRHGLTCQMNHTEVTPLARGVNMHVVLHNINKAG